MENWFTIGVQSIQPGLQPSRRFIVLTPTQIQFKLDTQCYEKLLYLTIIELWLYVYLGILGLKWMSWNITNREMRDKV